MLSPTILLEALSVKALSTNAVDDIPFYYFYFSEKINMAFHVIVSLANISHEMPSFIFSDNNENE